MIPKIQTQNNRSIYSNDAQHFYPIEVCAPSTSARRLGFILTMFNYIQTIRDRLDLKKKYPDYFGKHTQYIVRACIAALGLYAIIMCGVYGWGNKISVSCPASEVMCFNEYYSDSCVEDYCSLEYIPGGVTLGQQFPSQAFNGFFLLFAALVALAFGLNHAIYLRRQA